MRIWCKRCCLGLALLLTLAALLVTGGFVLLRGTPAYYRQSPLSAEERAQAAARAESTLSQMQNLAVDVQGAELQRRQAQTSPSVTKPHIPGARTFKFTDDELNALFNKWAELNNWKDLLARTVQEPMIVLQDGRVIFAGRMNIRNVDTVVSIHLAPSITPDGRLHLKLESILGGKLPLPRDTVITPMRDRVIQQIHTKLPGWQSRAEIGNGGATNDAAMKAALGKLMLGMLTDQPSEPVLFLPLVSQNGKTVPMKLTDVTIAEHTLSLTVVPMGTTERAGLLSWIKAPSQTASINP